MNDFLGQELKLGDTVVTVVKGYREFAKAKVVAFTPEQVRVEFIQSKEKFLTSS